MLGEMHIRNYTDAQLVPVQNGPAKKQIGTYKHIHIIDLKQYDNFLREIQSTISHDIPQTNSLFTTLRIEFDQTCDILE